MNNNEQTVARNLNLEKLLMVWSVAVHGAHGLVCGSGVHIVWSVAVVLMVWSVAVVLMVWCVAVVLMVWCVAVVLMLQCSSGAHGLLWFHPQ